MKLPTDEQLEIACMWLESNEGEDDERDACVVVAKWLAHERNERMLRSEARKAGVTVARLRRLIASARREH